MGLLPDVSNILAKLYTDRMAVYRYPESTPDADGATIANTKPHPVQGMEDVPCRLSLGSKDSPNMGDDKNPTDMHPTLICRPNIALQSGDFVVVIREGREIYSGNIGRPSHYGSSLQVLFRDKGVS